MEYVEITHKQVIKYFPALKLDEITGQWYLRLDFDYDNPNHEKIYRKEKTLTNYKNISISTGEIVGFPRVFKRLLRNMGKVRCALFEMHNDIITFKVRLKNRTLHYATVCESSAIQKLLLKNE